MELASRSFSLKPCRLSPVVVYLNAHVRSGAIAIEVAGGGLAHMDMNMWVKAGSEKQMSVCLDYLHPPLPPLAKTRPRESSRN